MTVYRDNFRIISQLDALISQIYFGRKLYMFRTVPLSIHRSFSLYTQQWYMSYRFADSLRAVSGWNILILLASCQHNMHDINHCCVYYSEKTPDDGQKTCPKHVEFHSKNKSEKLVYLVGFIIRNVSDMFRTSKCSSSGRLEHAILWYFFHASI